MVSTLAFMSSAKPLHHIYNHSQEPPSSYTTSPSVQMPNVFVVPPEEEDSPTWCYFDAAQTPEHDLSTLPDVDVLETALNVFQHSDSFPPVFSRDSAHGSMDAVVMPRRGERQSISDVLMKDEEENQGPRGTVRGREPGDDSEIVEVVKVKRNDRQNPTDSAAPPTKRSKTFRSRASKAFRSIKNVGRSTKPNAKNIFASSVGTQVSSTSRQTQRQTEEESPLPPPPPRIRSPTLSRRGSFILSQIFHTPNLKTRASFDTSFPSEPAFPSSSTQSSPYTHLSHADTSPSLTPDHNRDHDHDSLRPSSPTSTQSFSHSRRRLSILNLQRLFSFSPSPDHSTTPTSTPTMSCDSSVPSTSSTSSGPDTPMDDPYPPELVGSGKLGGAAGTGEWRSPKTESPPVVAPGDISIEMRLDSLHFDSMSFDVDRF